MRLLMVPIMAIIFIGWILYKTFITKDIKNYKNEVFGGVFFIIIWVVIIAVVTNI
jgi:hypothetical protein